MMKAMSHEIRPDIREFHNACLVADLHADTWLAESLFGYNIRNRHKRWIKRNPFFNHIDIPRAIEGGLNLTGQGVVLNPLWPKNKKPGAFRMNNRKLK